MKLDNAKTIVGGISPLINAANSLVNGFSRPVEASLLVNGTFFLVGAGILVIGADILVSLICRADSLVGGPSLLIGGASVHVRFRSLSCAWTIIVGARILNVRANILVR